MKSYDEMAESVLQRYSEYKAARKRRLRTAASVGVTVCCVGVIALTGVGIQASRGGDVTVRDGKPIVTTVPVTDSDGQTISVRKCGETEDCEQIEAPVPEPDVPYDVDPQVPERPRDVEDEPDVTMVSTGEHGADTEPALTTANLTLPKDEQIHLPNIAVPVPQPADDPPAYDDFIINELTYYEGPMSFVQYSEDVRVDTFGELKMCDYLGFYLNELSSPAVYRMEYVQKHLDYTVISDADGNILEDIADFTYVHEFLGSQLTVFASKVAPPAESFDFKFMFLSKDPSYIELDNGETLKVVVGRFFTNNTNFEYFITDFECNGVYYRIETKNVQKALIEDVIREIATRWHFGDKGVMEESQ